MEYVGCTAIMVSFFKEDRDTILPGGALEELGIDSSSSIVRRKGAFSKKLRSWVVETWSVGIRQRWNVVRLDRFFQGRLVMTPVSLKSRNDGRFPSKNASLRTGTGRS